MTLVIFFLFGLIIGSFLNVVVLRAEKGVSIGGRSHCPACQALLHWHDNLPVISYLFLWGRCRSCRAHISLQYPLVELLTGVTFALVGSLYFAPHFMTGEGMMMTAWYLVLMSIMIAILVADLRTMEIPLMFLVAGVAVSLFFILLLTVLFFGEGWREPGAWWQLRLLGGAVAAFLFWLLVFFSRETWMGMGDVWLAGTVGLVVGIESLLFTLTLSFLVGALVGIALLVSKKKGLRSEIPFAPFLVLGLFLSLVLAWINPPWLALFILPL